MFKEKIKVQIRIGLFIFRYICMYMSIHIHICIHLYGLIKNINFQEITRNYQQPETSVQQMCVIRLKRFNFHLNAQTMNKASVCFWIARGRGGYIRIESGYFLGFFLFVPACKYRFLIRIGTKVAQIVRKKCAKKCRYATNFEILFGISWKNAIKTV